MLIGVAGQLVASRRPLNVLLGSLSEIDIPENVLGRLLNAMLTPSPAGSLAGRIVISPGVPNGIVLPPKVTIVTRPARSPGFGGPTRSNVVFSDTGSPRSVAVACPVPTWHAGVGCEVRRQAPPPTDASASRPGGRLKVRSFGESLPLGANLRSI